ncbi:13186_t:CDS:2 [Rhizophagus irregularis]|nr:13186_t:CDS:2 [Rhizophagus irregularis]
MDPGDLPEELLRLKRYVYEFTIQLPRHPSSSDVLVVHGTINDYLPHVLRNEDNEDIIARSFVPFAPSSHCEDDSINEVLVRMQKKTTPIVSFVWPNIDSIPINEFHTPRYITRAFPTLYPYGKADLCAEKRLQTIEIESVIYL